MMHRRIGLFVVAAVAAASTTTALASPRTTSMPADRHAVTSTSAVLSAAATIDNAAVLQRIATAAHVATAVRGQISAASVKAASVGVRFGRVSVAGLPGRARDIAIRWNALVANGTVAAAQRQVSSDGAQIARAVAATTMRVGVPAAGGIVPCTVDTADTVLLVAFFVEVDAVFIPETCGADFGCLDSREIPAIEAQEFLTVILLESDINCYLFG